MINLKRSGVEVGQNHNFAENEDSKQRNLYKTEITIFSINTKTLIFTENL